MLLAVRSRSTMVVRICDFAGSSISRHAQQLVGVLGESLQHLELPGEHEQRDWLAARNRFQQLQQLVARVSLVGDRRVQQIEQDDGPAALRGLRRDIGIGVGRRSCGRGFTAPAPATAALSTAAGECNSKARTVCGLPS